MIPFVNTDPENPSELVNLLAIKKVCDLADGSIAVHFIDGKITTYGRDDIAGKVIKGSCHMARVVYEKSMMAILDPKQIVTAADMTGRPIG